MKSNDKLKGDTLTNGGSENKADHAVKPSSSQWPDDDQSAAKARVSKKEPGFKYYYSGRKLL